MTQKDLAEHLGLTQAAISRWVAGTVQPKVGDAAKVLEFARQYEPEITFEQLFLGKEAA